MCPGVAAAGLYRDIDQAGGPAGDSGVDLRFSADVEFPPSGDDGRPTLVDLDVRARCIWLGKNVPFLIVPRSSICKTPLGLANSVGVIDRGYTGPLKVAVRNFSAHAVLVRRGDSLFQLARPDFEPATVRVVAPDAPAFAIGTLRGAGGFGSTGAGGASGGLGSTGAGGAIGAA
jgi:dUTPase